jgi:hypothetical protein
MPTRHKRRISRHGNAGRETGYAWVTTEMFDRKLEELLGQMSAGTIMQIPGVYEAVSEELNNDVLRDLEHDRDTAERHGKPFPRPSKRSSGRR